jgi:hypothetical protein
VDAQFLEDVIDFFIDDASIAHMGDGKSGIGRLTGSDSASGRARSEFYGRLFKEFIFTDIQTDRFTLAFDTLKAEKLRKECVENVRKAKAQAQVLGSSPSVLQRLLSVYALTESPAKQVPSSPAASSAQGSAASSAISAQVRLCSPKLQPGEVLPPVQLVCRSYAGCIPVFPRMMRLPGSSARSPACGRRFLRQPLPVATELTRDPRTCGL